MLESYKHINSQGDVLDFLSLGIFANESDLRDYKWTYTSENGKIKSFSKEPREFTIPFIFVTNKEKANEIKNKFYEHFDVDVWNKNSGYFLVNDYKLYCYAIENAKSDYLQKNNLLTINLKFVTNGQNWVKETSKSFIGSADYTEDTGGINFPFNFTFNFPKSLRENRIINSSIYECDFELTIYGSVENPSITIGGNEYKLNATIGVNEYVVIKSKNHKIYKYNSVGIQSNWFKYKDSMDIFTPIQPGTNNVSWTTGFGFDIKLIQERGEPEWN